MYPRNAASPERISIGPVVQISDGAVQTSGVSVKVMPQGGAAAAAAGTIGYEEGIVHYTPTQAETDYTSFILIAYKTGCIPASIPVVTTTVPTVLAAVKTSTDNIPDVAVSGAVVFDGSNGATTFKTDLSSSSDNFYNGRLCVITSGAMAGFCAVVTDYSGTSKFLTLEAGLPDTVPSESTFKLIPNGQNPVTMRTAVGLGTANLDTQLTVLGYLPAVTAGAAGGLFIAGANAATTFASLTVTGALTVSDGVIISASTTNRSGMTVTGNGTGTGLTLVGGSNPTLPGFYYTTNALLLASKSRPAIAAIVDTPDGRPAVWCSAALQANITGDLSGSVGSVVTDALFYAASAVDDAAASTTVFVTSLASSVDDHYKGAFLRFTSGALAGQTRKILSYAQSTKTITLETALTSAPANTVTFVILGRSE